MDTAGRWQREQIAAMQRVGVCILRRDDRTGPVGDGAPGVGGCELELGQSAVDRDTTDEYPLLVDGGVGVLCGRDAPNGRIVGQIDGELVGEELIGGEGVGVTGADHEVSASEGGEAVVQ